MAGGAAGKSAFVEVVDLQMAEKIEDRKPVGASETFEAGSKAITWVKLKVKEPETVVKLRYFINGKKAGTSRPLTVRKSPSFRTWFRRKLNKSGQWKVEVLDADDKPVHSMRFTVK
jgi:hypothetical protein